MCTMVSWNEHVGNNYFVHCLKFALSSEIQIALYESEYLHFCVMSLCFHFDCYDKKFRSLHAAFIQVMV